MRNLKCKRGQSTAEYAIVIALVLGAAIAMQTYVRRTIQDRVADGADSMPLVNLSGAGIDQSALVSNRAQYEPQYASSNTSGNTNMNADAQLVGSAGSASQVIYGSRSESNRTGTQMEAGAN